MVKMRRKSNSETDLLKMIEEIERSNDPAPPKPKSLPTNYIRENVKKLRDLEKMKKEEKAKPAKTSPPSSKYINVKSKLHNLINPCPATGAARCSSCSRVIEEKLKTSDSLTENVSDSALSRLSTDNTVSSSKSTQSKSVSWTKDVKFSKSHPLGFLPKYLLEEKKKRQEEEKVNAEKLKKDFVPPGKKLLSNEERISTLTELIKNREGIYSELNKLPIANITFRSLHRKEELEKKLALLDEGIDVFSKSKVFVEIDENSF